MNDRYRINISNPRDELSVFIWDRKLREVIFKSSYPELSSHEQQVAKCKCEKFLKGIQDED